MIQAGPTEQAPAQERGPPRQSPRNSHDPPRRIDVLDRRTKRHYVGVAIKAVYLPFEPPPIRDVVGVEARNQFAAGEPEPLIQGRARYPG